MKGGDSLKYIEILKQYIKNSGLTLREISRRTEEKGHPVSQAYISKIINGEAQSPSDNVLRVLSEVTGGNSDSLITTAYIEKAPEEIKDVMEIAAELKIVYSLLYFLIDFLETYRETSEVNSELLHKIKACAWVLETDYKYLLNTSLIDDYPEYATELIAILKREYFPYNDSVTFMDHEFHFTKYVRENGNPIFKENPFPEMVKRAEEREELRIREEIEQYKKRAALPHADTKAPYSIQLFFLNGIQNKHNEEHDEPNKYIFVETELLHGREGFALRVQGDSMSGDRIYDGDTAIVVLQEKVDPHEIAVVSVKNDSPELKRVKVVGEMCMLIPSNPTMQPELLPTTEVKVLGKVIEVRFRIE